MNTAAAQGARTPWHLWLIGIGTLLFNLLGVTSFTMTKLGMLGDVGMTPEQIAFLDNYPLLANVTWAMGVWGAFAGSLLLLLRSRWAVTAMAVGTIGLIGTTIYNYGIIEVPASMQSAGLDVTIWAVTLFLLFYSWRMAKAGVLR
jgi:hypothetical protein